MTNAITATQRGVTRSGAIWTRRQILFDLPDLIEALLASKIYENDLGHMILVVDLEGESLERVREAVEQRRPITLVITVAVSFTGTSEPIDLCRSATDERWLFDEPCPVPVLNQLLSLRDPTLPEGFLFFDGKHGTYDFTTSETLDDDQMQQVRESSVAINAPVTRFRQYKELPSLPLEFLITSRQARFLPAALRACLERDEDIWRQDSIGAADNSDLNAELLPARSQCLFDVSAQGETTLSELLCLYDVVNLLPGPGAGDWLKSNHMDTRQLVELTRRGHVRLVLPMGLHVYPTDLLGAVYEAAPNALILSRELAARTLRSNARKDPITYGPFNAEFKAAALASVARTVPDGIAPMFAPRAQPSMRSPVADLNYEVATRGAMGMMAVGLGARLADAMESKTGSSPRLELMLASASVEWALALGASYVPRSMGAYDETHNARVIASIWSRSALRETQPIPDRMHQVVSGLLAVTSTPPLEVVDALTSSIRARFSAVVGKLLSANADQAELLSMVELLNAETRAFERRKAFLKRWKVDSLAAAAFVKPLSDAVDTGSGLFTSVVAGWIYDVISRRISAKSRDRLSDHLDVLLGMCLAPSLDAVIVSRTRARLAMNE